MHLMMTSPVKRHIRLVRARPSEGGVAFARSTAGPDALVFDLDASGLPDPYEVAADDCPDDPLVIVAREGSVLPAAWPIVLTFVLRLPVKASPEA